MRESLTIKTKEEQGFESIPEENSNIKIEDQYSRKLEGMEQFLDRMKRKREEIELKEYLGGSKEVEI